MESIQLTKDSYALLKAIYEEYKNRKKDGLSKFDAILFGSADDIRTEILPKWNNADISNACWELAAADLLHCAPGDDEVQACILSDKGISYMEQYSDITVGRIWAWIKEILSIIR